MLRILNVITIITPSMITIMSSTYKNTRIQPTPVHVPNNVGIMITNKKINISNYRRQFLKPNTMGLSKTTQSFMKPTYFRTGKQYIWRSTMGLFKAIKSFYKALQELMANLVYISGQCWMPLKKILVIQFFPNFVFLLYITRIFLSGIYFDPGGTCCSRRVRLKQLKTCENYKIM